MQIYLDESIKSFFKQTDGLFDEIMALRGERYRLQNGRLTQRILIGKNSYFIKQHYGVGWREIIKNLLQLRKPVVNAMNEVWAIKKLAALNVAVPNIVGYGIRGKNPARQESFIIMDELAPTISLEDYCKDWQDTKPLFRTKLNLIKKIAEVAHKLHYHGINHRDFYICHFLLKSMAPSLELYLIDLHRAQLRRQTPARWITKDLSALYFSSMNCCLTKRDLYRFMKYYRQLPLRQILNGEKIFWQHIQSRGEKIYRDHQ